jgi:hypothetical protein
MNPTKKELCAIFEAFSAPRSHHQKLTLAKIFVLRWAIASGINMQDSFDDPNNIKWCKGLNL